MQGAGDGGSAEREHIHHIFEVFDLFLVNHAEALFLINHQQAQVLKRHIPTQQPVGANQDVNLAFPRLGQRLAVFLW